MAKNKSNEKVHYELLYIIPNKFTEEESKKVDEKIKNNIIKKEGEITYTEQWGNKKLAYPVKHFSHGYYNLVEFDLPGESLNELNKELNISEDILRHQIVKKKKRSLEEIEKEKRKAEEIKEKIKQEEEEEKEKKRPVPPKEEQVKKEEPEKSEEPAKEEEKEIKKEDKEQEDEKKEKKKEDKKKDKKKEKKEDDEDLDKKLDDILNTENLLD